MLLILVLLSTTAISAALLVLEAVDYVTTRNTSAAAALTVAESVIETVVDVESSSGIVIYSDSRLSLVLTAYHTLSWPVDDDGKAIPQETPLYVIFRHHSELGQDNEVYDVLSVYPDAKNDLALLEIAPGGQLYSARVSITNPKVGSDVFIAGNPNHNYRTLTKGVISNIDRYRQGRHVFQISGGVIIGLSGGGAFNMDGELIDLASSVSTFGPIKCYKYPGCIPIYYIGYFITLDNITDFLLSSTFADKFKYLNKEE